MTNKHILDLTLRLSQALDQNYDVVNMDTVLLVISALEGATITKEQLEATRLAKYINQLRRRTKCENLARRAKSLLKRWREMVGIQQSNEPATVTGVASATTGTIINSSSIATAPFNMPVSDNAVSTSQTQRQQYHSTVKHESQQQTYHSQPSSPVHLQEKSDANDFIISMSNPATASQIQKSSNTNVRKKRRIEKNMNKEPITQQQQQPTSFANLITGLGTTFGSSRKTTRDKSDPVKSVKPVETYVIEHSSNSNSDLICIPSNTASSNFTSITDVPPVVIDLQDTNSSMNSLVSKDVTNAFSSFCRNKNSSKKSKKEKRRKDRNVASRQNQPLQDCDEQNTTTAAYSHKRATDVLLLDEKSHSVCPTISNISEILSLSNSSISSSVFPSADAMSKNVFSSTQNELVSSSLQVSKSDLTFAGKFKQNSTATSTECNAINYNSDSMNVNIISNNSPNQSKFSLFGGMEATNSNDSSSCSRNTPFQVVNAMTKEAGNKRFNIEDIKHDINEKSMTNMSNKGNSSTDNAIAVGVSTIVGAQHCKSIDLTTMDFSSQQIEKQPKKRGRKKGSKGVDSVIAKETSLSSQMLISSIGVTGKKVKTTKELYAEMENRKLRNAKAPGLEIPGNLSATSIGSQQQEKTLSSISSRRPSFCSDILESDSLTMTSEPSRDSGNILDKTTVGKRARETTLDNNSNYSKLGSEFKIDDVRNVEGSGHIINEYSAQNITSKIKLELEDIIKLLLPTPSVEEIEYECFNSITPCTCTIEEVNAPAENESNESIDNNNSKDSNSKGTNSTNISERKSNHLEKIQINQMISVTDKVKSTDNEQKEILPQLVSPANVKKSIFDLDFDDDEDPLNSIIADIGKNSKTESEIIISRPVIDEKSDLPLSTEGDLGKIDHHNAPYALNVPATCVDNIVCPSYEVKIDTDCKAKYRFEVQTQKITKFHIDTLHNCFISNVNGNWNHVDTLSTHSCKDEKDARNSILDSVIDGYDVVPFYGSDINEKIVKDLSHIKFTKNFKITHSKCQNQNQILFRVPFLGVSRIPIAVGTKLHSKDMNNLSLDEEKENVENKLNSNNVIHKTSALDTSDTKEREDLGMNSVCVQKNTETSSDAVVKSKKNKNLKKSLKRTTKHATLIKRSTIKRLKLAGKKDLDANTSDSSSSGDSDNVDKFRLHRNLFYHDEIRPVVRSGSHFYTECIFRISSCSSDCSSTDEEATNENINSRKRTASSSSSSISSFSPEYHMLNLQQEIMQAELQRAALAIEKRNKKHAVEISDAPVIENCDNDNKTCVNNSDNDDNGDGDNNEGNDLPEENNHMLLSFNNIYNNQSCNKNAEDKNEDPENNMLKQQLQNCDDYNNLNNNFNLIKYIDNKTRFVNINNNNNTNSCSYNLSDTNINISSSGCSHENPTNSTFINHLKHNNNSNSNSNINDNDVQIKPFKDSQTDKLAVDKDVIIDDDGNNCDSLQQFKEWHEVLQLRSYNDELLTVLPYVVLE